MAKISSIRNPELFPVLIENGFNKAKNCGSDVEGFITALGIGYIENLILAQNKNTNGLIFIREFLQEEEVKKEFFDLVEVFDKIFEGQADHLDFATRTKNEPELLERILAFTSKAFDLPEVSSIYELKDALDMACRKLNLQIFLYDGFKLIFEVKTNPYIYPLRLNFYQTIENETEAYYLLYHKNYISIDPANNNTSLEFFPENFQDSQQLVLSKLLIKELSLVESLSSKDQNILKVVLTDLKSISAFGTEAEQIVSNLLK